MRRCTRTRTTRTLRTAAVGAALLAAAIASARPRSAAAAPALAARLTPGGFKALAGALQTLAPAHLALDPFETEVAGCARIEVPSTVIDMAWSSIDISPEGGQLRVAARADLRAAATVKVDACGVVKVTCDVRFSTSNAALDAAYAPRLADGRLRLEAPAFNVDLPPERTNLQVTDCGLATDLVSQLVAAVQEQLLEAGVSALEELGQRWLPERLEGALTRVTDFSTTSDSLQIDAGLSAIELSAQEGLLVQGAFSVQPTAVAPCTAAAAAPSPPPAASGPALPPDVDHLSLALSIDAVASAVHAAWRGGLLCRAMTAEEMAPKLRLVLAALLGLERVDRVALAAPQPPAIEPLPGPGAQFQVRVPRLEITVEGAAGGAPQTNAVQADLSGRLALAFDPDRGALALEVQEARLTAVEAGADAAFVDALNTALQALVATTLSGLEILKQALVVAEGDAGKTYLYFPRLQLAGRTVALSGRLFVQPLSDLQAPETRFAERVPQFFRAGTVSLTAAGTDDYTPAELLAFTWRVNGGGWSEPSFSPKMVQAFDDGDHVVEVAAIDLNGNRDPWPAVVQLAVDSLPPTVTPTSQPAAEVEDPMAAAVAFTVSDERTPAEEIEVRVRVLFGADDALLFELPFERGLTRANVPQPASGTRYTIEITARDAAGNVSEPWRATLRYVGPDRAAQPGGCALAGRAPAAAGSLLAALAVALLAAAIGARRAARIDLPRRRAPRKPGRCSA